MKLYRFSPIKTKEGLLEAINHIHFSCYKLCKQAFGKYFPNARNIGIFCHYNDEYEFLTKIRQQLTEPSDNPNQKYYTLHEPIIIPANNDIPETAYKYLYIRKPDPTPYGRFVGDVDFFLESDEYTKLKTSLLNGTKIKGAQIYDRPGWDTIQLSDI